eukprot:6467026-Amphidinium_carterae.1
MQAEVQCKQSQMQAPTDSHDTSRVPGLAWWNCHCFRLWTSVQKSQAVQQPSYWSEICITVWTSVRKSQAVQQPSYWSDSCITDKSNGKNHKLWCFSFVTTLCHHRSRIEGKCGGSNQTCKLLLRAMHNTMQAQALVETITNASSY